MPTKSYTNIIPTLPVVAESAETVEPTAIDAAFLYEDGVGYTDYTTEANEDTIDDVPLVPHPQNTNDAFYFGGAGTFDWIFLEISTKGVSTYSVTWEYWNGAWVTLGTYLRDEDVERFEHQDECSYVFDIPDDWVATVVNGSNRYWVRARLLTIGTQTVQPLAKRIRIRITSVLHTLAISDSLIFSREIRFDIGQIVPDLLPMSDLLQFDAGRVISNTLPMSDLSQFDVGQVISDSLPVSDLLQFDVGQIVPDLLPMSDLPQFDVGQIVSDQLPLFDSPAFGIYPYQFEDDLDFSGQVQFAVAKPVSDVLTFWGNVRFTVSQWISDVLSLVGAVVKSVFKPISDVQVLSESWIKTKFYAYPVGFQDHLYFTDAIQFDIEKVLQDSLGFLDALAFMPGVTFADLFTMSDVLLAGGILSLVDSLQVTDEVIFVGDFKFADMLALVDGVAKDVTTTFADSLPIFDALMWGREFSDSLPMTDYFHPFAVGQVIRDTLPLSYTFDRVWDAYRDYSDILQLSDEVTFNAAITILDILNLSDTPLFLVGKVITDQLPLTDFISPFEILKNILDVLAIGDAVEKHQYMPEEIPQIQWVLTKLAERQIDPYELHIAIGESDVEGTVHDTVLWDEVHRKEGIIRVVANTVFVRAVFGQDEPTADGVSIKEIAIFDAATGGTLIERWVLGSPAVKDNIDEVVVECAVTIVHGDIEALTHGPTDAFGMTDRIEMVLTKG